MYKVQKPIRTNLLVNKSIEGETIEKKVERIMNNNEPITDGAPIIFQERGDGVDPMCDIRTDRFDLAIDGMEQVRGQIVAKREERAKAKDGEGGEKPANAGSIDATTTSVTDPKGSS